MLITFSIISRVISSILTSIGILQKYKGNQQLLELNEKTLNAVHESNRLASEMLALQERKEKRYFIEKYYKRVDDLKSRFEKLSTLLYTESLRSYQKLHHLSDIEKILIVADPENKKNILSRRHPGYSKQSKKHIGCNYNWLLNSSSFKISVEDMCQIKALTASLIYANILESSESDSDEYLKVFPKIYDAIDDLTEKFLAISNEIETLKYIVDDILRDVSLETGIIDDNFALKFASAEKYGNALKMYFELNTFFQKKRYSDNTPISKSITTLFIYVYSLIIIQDIHCYTTNPKSPSNTFLT